MSIWHIAGRIRFLKGNHCDHTRLACGSLAGTSTSRELRSYPRFSASPGSCGTLLT